MRLFEGRSPWGADSIEIDVRFDGDENVIVFHDRLLVRLTGAVDDAASLAGGTAPGSRSR